jgi:predicted Holliday junction resolvase-like endonuclease
MFRRNVLKTCPKCRCEVKDSNQLVKLFFGTNTTTEEMNNEIDTLLDESEMCRKKMEFMLQEMNKNVSENHLNVNQDVDSSFQLKIIEQNAKKITEIREEMVHNKKETDTGAFRLKNLAVLLSRTDESRRIQAYYDSLNN